MMAPTQNSILLKALVWVIATTFLDRLALAEEEDQASAEDTEAAEEIDEIIVYGGQRDDPVDVDALYEDLLRERILKDMERLRVLEDDYKWRSPKKSALVTTPPRITWGYDPRDESRMRQDTSLTDLPTDDTKPATIFRFDF
jgi:hypothetical protein